MTSTRTRKIELIPLDQITILNPRSRNRRQHREIVDNIDRIGLKRPITVSRRPGGGYSAVCGEGRLEAFRQLGQTEIPAIVVDAAEPDCMVMSLVENLARRRHRPIDLMQEIGALKRRGYSDAQVADKIGVTASWVGMISGLLERGEERLVSAVETGLMPISLAVDISRAKDADTQRVLTEAYEQGKIKGKKIGPIRRLLEQRARGRRTAPMPLYGRKGHPRKLTPEQLLKIMEREAEKQRMVVKRAEITQNKLLIATEVLRRLLEDDRFRILLQEEGLDTLPQALADRMRQGAPR